MCSRVCSGDSHNSGSVHEQVTVRADEFCMPYDTIHRKRHARM